MPMFRVPGFTSLQAPLTLVAGLVVTLSLSGWIYFQDQDLRMREFEQEAMDRILAIQNGMSDTVQALDAITLAYQTFEPVSREQFHMLTQPLVARHPYVQAFSFQRLLSRAQRAEYEAGMRQYYPDFGLTEERDGKIVPAAERDSYRVVDYIEPYAGNEAVLGRNLDLGPGGDPALRRAAETGQASATGLVRLLREAGQPHGFVVIKPVYQHPAAGAGGGTGIRGYMAVVFRAGELLEKTLNASKLLRDSRLHLSVYAGADRDEGALVYRKGMAPPEPDAGLWGRAPWQPVYQVLERGFEVAGAPWHVVVMAQRSWFDFSLLDALLLLLCGVVASCMAALYLDTLNSRSRRIEQLVQELNLRNDYLVEDISGRKRAESALRQSQEDLRRLAGRQETIREDERKRIAREVHDELGGLLTGIKAHVSVSAHRASLAGAPPDKLLFEASALIDTAIETVRRIITDLRPSVLDQLGVWAALEWYVGQIGRTGLECSCQIEDDLAAIAIDAERSTMIFRIVQEALTNVVRHADATRVEIRASRQAGMAVVEIEDNGKGIAAERLLEGESWGILGMHERSHYFGGQLRISGAAGQGTLVTLRLPLGGQEDQPPTEQNAQEAT